MDVLISAVREDALLTFHMISGRIFSAFVNRIDGSEDVVYITDYGNNSHGVVFMSRIEGITWDFTREEREKHSG